MVKNADLIIKKLAKERSKKEICKTKNDLIQIKKFYKSYFMRETKLTNWFYDEELTDEKIYIIGREDFNLVYRLDYKKYKEQIKKYLVLPYDLSGVIKRYLENNELFTQYYNFINYHGDGICGIYLKNAYLLDDVIKVLNVLNDTGNQKLARRIAYKLIKKGYDLDYLKWEYVL